MDLKKMILYEVDNKNDADCVFEEERVVGMQK